MSLVAAKTDLVQIFASAPSFNIDDVVAGDIAGMERAVDIYEADAAKWRSGIALQFHEEVKKLEAAMAGVPKAVADEAIVDMTSTALKVIEESLSSYSVPLHAAPDTAAKLDLIASLSRNSGNAVKRVFRRIEGIRVAQHAATVDLYYALLAFQSEHLDDAKGGETFNDSEKLRVFLRQHMPS